MPFRFSVFCPLLSPHEILESGIQYFAFLRLLVGAAISTTTEKDI